MKYLLKNKVEYLQEEVSIIMHDFNVCELTAKILLSKNLRSHTDIENFLNVDSILITPGIELPNVQKAVDRIESAMMVGEKIAIYGDYDVDGICGVSIVINVFKELGYDEVFYYIPNRIKEGYGLNNDAINYFKEQDCSLIITVDCGISNAYEIDFAKSLGIDVIVTDHHMPPDELPNAINVNPKLNSEDDTHNYCGAVVAMKLMCALIDEDLFFDYCDFAAIATIADMVELTGENRKIVKYGLQRINERKNKSIAYLVDECIKNKKTIKVDDIAYFIAPSINASGRVDQADKCVELFINNTQMPQETASILANDNLNRRAIEKKTLKQAIIKIDKINFSKSRSIVLYDEDWHPGVLGIAASKIKNIYFRPVVLLTKNNGMVVGSARSIDGVNIHDAIKYCSEYVERFGGHFMAAGLSIEEENIDKFKKKFEEYLLDYNFELFSPRIKYDMNIKTSDLTYQLLDELDMLAPFGKGNSAPSFLLEDIKISNYQEMGDSNQHFRCQIDNAESPVAAVAFSNSINDKSLQTYNAIVSVNKNEWNNKTTLQTMIKDVKPFIDKKNNYDNFDDEFKLTLSQGVYNGKLIIINEISLEKVLEIIKSTVFGKLILVLDKNAAKNSYQMFQDVIDTLDIRFINIENSKLNSNTILFAPDIENNDFNKYDEIYIVSSYDIKGYYKILHDYNKVYIIKNNIEKRVLPDFNLDVDKLRKMFLSIRSTIINGEIDKIDYNTSIYEKWEIGIAIKIFIEVGLIKKQNSKPKYLLTNIKKVDIKSSMTYKNIEKRI